MPHMDELLERVIKEKASDLLISAGAPPALRINGELTWASNDPLTHEKSKSLVYECLTKEQRDAFETHKELDFSLVSGKKHRFRVNVYYQKQAVSAAFRPIPDKIPKLEDLGLPSTAPSLLTARQGLVLVTGPTGHGKTTTLASLIDRVNDTRACHVITIEDPIEYIHAHKHSIIDQREVGGDTNSFLDALRYAFRQNPDVILIGEMRDLETIQAALRAAETGHLVFATLHTNDAVQTIDRIIDVFPGDQQQQIRFQLSMCLLAILSHRLLPRADGKGLVLACELLRHNTAIANMIREGKTHQIYGIMQTAAKEGMVTMDAALKQLYLQGRITYDVAASHARNIKDIGSSTL